MRFETFLRLRLLHEKVQKGIASVTIVVQRQYGHTADFFMDRALKPADLPYPKWQEKPVGYKVESP